MTEGEPHRQQPTDEEKFAAAGAEDYLGVPVSDEELADVWTSRPDPDKSGAERPDQNKPASQDEPD